MIRDSGVWMVKKKGRCWSAVFHLHVSACDVKMSQTSRFFSRPSACFAIGEKSTHVSLHIMAARAPHAHIFSRFFWPTVSTFGMKKIELLAKVQYKIIKRSRSSPVLER